jgi:hypothetical protein
LWLGDTNIQNDVNSSSCAASNPTADAKRHRSIGNHSAIAPQGQSAIGNIGLERDLNVGNAQIALGNPTSILTILILSSPSLPSDERFKRLFLPHRLPVLPATTERLIACPLRSDDHEAFDQTGLAVSTSNVCRDRGTSSETVSIPPYTRDRGACVSFSSSPPEHFPIQHDSSSETNTCETVCFRLLVLQALTILI